MKKVMYSREQLFAIAAKMKKVMHSCNTSEHYKVATKFVSAANMILLKEDMMYLVCKEYWEFQGNVRRANFRGYISDEENEFIEV